MRNQEGAEMLTKLEKGILGNLPSSPNVSPLHKINIKKANRYLNHQSRRITKALNDCNYRRAFVLWMALIATSKIYQTHIFNRTMRRWYVEHSKPEALKLLKTFMHHMRNRNWKIKMERFYIQVNPTKKRPIGSPDWVSRCKAKMITEMVTAILRASNDLPWQHGYKEGKGIHTAIMALAERTRGRWYRAYEFDLTKFFNRVKWEKIYETCINRDLWLAEFMQMVVYQIQYKTPYGEKVEDEELREEDPKSDIVTTWKGGRHIFRRGLPQGLSFSPVLATQVLEQVEIKLDTIMYADDGIIIFNNQAEVDKLQEWKEEMENLGSEVSEEKSKWVEGPFKFLGFNIDLVERWIERDGIRISLDSDRLEKWLTNFDGTYGTSSRKAQDDWQWEVNEDSMIFELPNESDGIIPWMYQAATGKEYPGLKEIKNGEFRSVTRSSTECVERLMEIVKGWNLPTLKAVSYREWMDWPASSKKKGYEETFLPRVRHQTRDDGTTLNSILASTAAIAGRDGDGMGNATLGFWKAFHGIDRHTPYSAPPVNLDEPNEDLDQWEHTQKMIQKLLKASENFRSKAERRARDEALWAKHYGEKAQAELDQHKDPKDNPDTE